MQLKRVNEFVLSQRITNEAFETPVSLGKVKILGRRSFASFQNLAHVSLDGEGQADVLAVFAQAREERTASLTIERGAFQAAAAR